MTIPEIIKAAQQEEKYLLENCGKFEFHSIHLHSIPHPDIERAKRQGNLKGDPIHDLSGNVIDHVCLACGLCFASHGDDDCCWKVLKSADQLARYDAAKAVCDEIEFGV